MSVLIPYQTAAYNTADAATPDAHFLRSQVPAALVLDIAAGFAGVEEIPAYYVGDDGIRLTPVLDADGNEFKLSLTNKVLPVYFPCNIRLIKPISVAAMGVNWFSK